MLLVTASAFAAPCQPIDLHAAVQRTMDAYSDQDYTGAFTAALEARQGLPCAVDVAYPTELTTLYWLGAASAARTSQAEVAAEWYAVAGVVATRPSWNRLIQRTEPPESVQARDLPNNAIVKARSDLWVDGYHLAEGQELNLRAGPHLVQWRLADGTLTGEIVSLPSGPGSVGPEAAAAATTTVAPKPRSKAARIVVGGAGALVAAGAGVMFYHALNLSRVDDPGDETWYRVAEVALGVGVGTMFVSTVFMADGTPGVGVSGRF